MNKFYITTSIVYVNAPPHIGFILELIQTDVLARYNRQKGREVWFLTGTDEHGIKVLRAAQKAGLKPGAFVSKIATQVKNLKKVFNLSWNDFIRTSDKKRHWPGALKLFKILAANQDIYLKKYSGLYCVGCEKFITEKELVSRPVGRDSSSIVTAGLCPIHLKKPEFIEEENFFFKLSKYGKKIESLIKSRKLEIIPESRRNEILSFLKKGAEDISISRLKSNNSWGIPIPNSNQTLYVWLDALSNYISAVGFGCLASKDKNKFKKLWPADVHIVGKDIIRFHAVIWPAFLMSAKLPLFKKLLVHGFITIEGKKISKSIGKVIDPFELAKKYSTDPVRYYLLREIPSDNDGDFSYQKFEERYNTDLANGLGNFASRTIALANNMDFPDDLKVLKEIEVRIEKTRKTVDFRINEFKLHEALASIWELIKFGDRYVNASRPWETKDKKTIFNLIVILDNLSALIEPFLPETSLKIKKAIKWEKGKLKIKKIKPLFPKIESSSFN